MKRSSGILMAISSLPSPYGIGTLGPVSYTHLDVYKRQLLCTAAAGRTADGGNMCPIQCLPTAGTVFLHFAQKTLAIGNVIGYTHRIPTATAHSTSCAAAAKEKENEPLWLAVRQCGDLS